MATKWYKKAVPAIATGKVNLVSDDIKVMLTTSAYVPNRETQAVKADVTNEVTGTGYTAGGKSLTGKTLSPDEAATRWTWDASDLTFTGVSLTCRYAVIYDNTHADKPLIGYVDFGSDQKATDQDFTVEWRDSKTSRGILEIAGSPSC
jgi:hypothetical protein